MKCHKIAGIDKSICSCEQKIAYNFAFMWFDIGKKILLSDKTDEEKEKSISDIYESVRRSLKEEKFKKFNIETIMEAFKHGFKNYCLNFFIATDYEKIGETFKIGGNV